MTTAAAKEIEQSAQRRRWQFWKRHVEQSMDPDVGLKNIKVRRGITTLPEEKHEVKVSFTHFGYRAGPVTFSGYPMLRRFHWKITLEAIEADTGWQTKTEYQQTPESREESPEKAFVKQLTFPG